MHYVSGSGHHATEHQLFLRLTAHDMSHGKREERFRSIRQLTRVEPLAPPGVGVPDEHVCRLVGDDGEEVSVLVPAEAAAHARQPHLLHHLGVPVVDVDALVVPRGGQVAARRPLPREEDAARAVGRVQREQLPPRRPHRVVTEDDNGGGGRGGSGVTLFSYSTHNRVGGGGKKEFIPAALSRVPADLEVRGRGRRPCLSHPAESSTARRSTSNSKPAPQRHMFDGTDLMDE